MGVYIKGMKLPKSCQKCPCYQKNIHDRGDDSRCSLLNREAMRSIRRYDCPLIPAADARPVVRGKWNRTDAYPHRLYCSVCYKTYLKNDELLERWEFPLNFCPNCGAKMDGET